MVNLDRIRGALFGVAVGDALGAPVEFMTAEEIMQKHGKVTKMLAGGWLDVEPGEITDDTQMTLCVAEGIALSPVAPIEKIGERFIYWYGGQPKDVGATCECSIRNAIKNLKTSSADVSKAWFDAAQETDTIFGGQTAGNGALMRTVFTGLYYGEAHAGVTEAVARMTHWNEESAEACLIYSQMIALFTTGSGLKTVFDVIRGTRYAVIDRHPQPTGYVVDGMCCALNCLLRENSFESALAAAVNLGGDADTIGAITGGLAGALYGYATIPALWLESLDSALSEKLFKLADIAYANRTNS